VLAAINVGTYRFALGAFGPPAGTLSPWRDYALQAAFVVAITVSQAAINHLGIGITSRLTDFSGYWIILIAGLLTICLLAFAPSLDVRRLITFGNYSGTAGGGTWPRTEQLLLLFALGALLPAYTITGFDASAHASEETVAAVHSVPRGIVRSVMVSGGVGWVLLCAVVLAAPSVPEAATRGDGAFLWILRHVVPRPLATSLIAGIVMAQYLCGLATVTSASRMAYAFARDGGVPFSQTVRWVCPRRRSPAVGIWAVSAAAVLFTLYTPIYSTITAVCTILLYISYALPTALGARAHGRTWTTMGPWHLGAWFRPLAWASVAGCLTLIGIGVQPPNERALWVVGGMAVVLRLVWIGGARSRFPGPPHLITNGSGPARRLEVDENVA
jgi:amino acid transporter